MAFVDGSVVNVALPVLQVDFNATAAGVQWVVESYALFLGALILIGGALGDRLGRRKIYVLGTSIFTVASVACGLAPTLNVLIVARAVQGIGAALLVPGSLAIISATFPEETRGKAIGTWSGFSAIASGAGPIIGGYLIQVSSWRAVFFLNVPLATGVILIALRFIPETRDESASGRLDWLGAATAVLGLGGLVLGLINASTLSTGPEVWLPLGIGVLGLAAFLVTEARVAAPMMPLSVFRSRTFLGANILTLLLYGALGGTMFFLPFNLIRVQGYTPAEAGAAFLPSTILLFTLSRWSGGLINRYGAKLPLVVGPTLAAAGLALAARPSIGGPYWTTYFPAILAIALGFSVLVAPLTTAVMNAASPGHSGVASGINNAAARVAGLVMIAIFGIIAVQAFSRILPGNLAKVPIPQTARAAVQGQANKLIAARIPHGIQGSARAMTQHAIAISFVDSFRIVMLAAAALALCGAAVALFLVEGTPSATR
jgi:EmrB/QacA subfamily drug resistance transporter